MNDPRVFVVDDDPSVRRALSRLLAAAGYASETFGDPAEFAARSPYPGPACLVLDYQLPGMTGLELQERLRDSGHLLPIVFVSGHGDIPISVQAMRHGAVDFLPKPFEDEQLLAAVASAIDRDRQELAQRTDLQLLTTRHRTLSRREREVLELVVTGLLNKQVASRLGITEKTVKAHRARVMEKMGAHSLAELVRMADRLQAVLAAPG